MVGVPVSSRRTTAATVMCLVLLAPAGCVFNNKVQPLTGEDPKSLAVSGERQVWLERTGATRAFEDLRKALRAGDSAAALSLVGPQTRSLLQAQARRVHRDLEDLLASGKAEGLGLPGVPDPIAALAAEGPTTVREADPFDPARRAARLRIRTEGRDEFLVPAVFTDSGWQLELVGKDAVPPQTNPPPAPTNPS